jgi:hypothetical protein
MSCEKRIGCCHFRLNPFLSALRFRQQARKPLTKTFGEEMKIQQKIPVFFRVPICLLTHAFFAFAPMIGLLVFHPFNASAWLLIGLGVAWIVVFDRFLTWRLDCFWNVRCMQNRTGKPSHPDNYREFTTLKGWLGWLFLGKDYECKAPNKAVDSTTARVTPPAGQEPRHGQP